MTTQKIIPGGFPPGTVTRLFGAHDRAVAGDPVSRWLTPASLAKA